MCVKKYLHIEKSKYSKHTKGKTTHIIYVQKYGKKKKYYFTNIFMYNPKRDKTLSTSKKGVKNDGTCN
jgi:hypothetical protein